MTIRDTLKVDELEWYNIIIWFGLIIIVMAFIIAKVIGAI